MENENVALPQITWVKIGSLKYNPDNPRTITDERFEKLVESIQKFPQMLQLRPIICDHKGMVLGGNMRLKACRKAGLKLVPTIMADQLTPEQQREFIVKDNVGFGEWDWDILKANWSIDELQEWGLEQPQETETEKANATRQVHEGKLSELFGIPPFTILNAKEGWWMDRKAAWLGLGITSEDGREVKGNANAATFKGSRQAANPDSIMMNQTSVFDPVLCEVAYRWFCPRDGSVLDPFTGGSVRGIVAAKLGLKYTGLDLSQQQIEANYKNAAEVLGDIPAPNWINADSRQIDQHVTEQADFLFSCPPYADLERYSKDPADLSNMPYSEFKSAYFEIIQKSCQLLKQNRFACFVVGEVRGKGGGYYNFVGDTVAAFLQAGMVFYNEAILCTNGGTAAMRAGQFTKSRKLVKTHQNVLVFLKAEDEAATEQLRESGFLTTAHQNVLVFIKGNPTEATEAVGLCEFGTIENSTENG